ncbi:dirigent protein 1-like [Nymphaea colorata]|nr:dirigent protein 1-like [Nymphaea colorata]
MGRLSFPLEAFILTIFLLPLESPVSGAGTRGGYWKRKRLSITPVTITELHFYFHGTVSGRNTTAVKTASSPAPANFPTQLGVPMSLDYPLTQGPEPTSKMIGKGQGMYEAAEKTALTYSFTDGEFMGSTLKLMGRNSSFHRGGAMAVVAGTGAFRFARGYAFAKTRSSSPAGDAVVEYDVIVVH